LILAPEFSVDVPPQPKGSGSRKLIPGVCPHCRRRLPHWLGRLGPYVESADLKTKTMPANRLKRFVEALQRRARDAALFVADGFDAVALDLEFRLARPPSVDPRKRLYPATKPDVDKLARAVMDGLAGLLYDHDAQVTDLAARKRYAAPGESPGVVVRATAIDEPSAQQELAL